MEPKEVPKPVVAPIVSQPVAVQPSVPPVAPTEVPLREPKPASGSAQVRSPEGSVSTAKRSHDLDRTNSQADFEPLVPVVDEKGDLGTVNILEQIKPDPSASIITKSNAQDSQAMTATTESPLTSFNAQSQMETSEMKSSGGLGGDGISVTFDGFSWSLFIDTLRLLQGQQPPPGLEAEPVCAIAGHLLIVLGYPEAAIVPKEVLFCLHLESDATLEIGRVLRGFEPGPRLLEGYWAIKDALTAKIPVSQTSSLQKQKPLLIIETQDDTLWETWDDFTQEGTKSRASSSSGRAGEPSSWPASGTKNKNALEIMVSQIESLSFKTLLKLAKLNPWARSLVIWEALAEFVVLEGQISWEILRAAKRGIQLTCANRLLSPRNFICRHVEYPQNDRIPVRNKPIDQKKEHSVNGTHAYSCFGASQISAKSKNRPIQDPNMAKSAISNQNSAISGQKQQICSSGPSTYQNDQTIATIGIKMPNIIASNNRSSPCNQCLAEFYSPLSKHMSRLHVSLSPN